MLKVLRAVRSGDSVDQAGLDEIVKMMKLDPYEHVRSFLKQEIGAEPPLAINRGVKRIPIKGTTIQSSKGRAADYVFITHFDDRFVIKDKNKEIIADRDICNFLVALTRARRKVFLISNDITAEPTFLSWINTDRVARE